jgi:manganese transport protein
VSDVKNFLEIFLGILTAMGGDVEVGELTFALNSGSKFGYSLLPVVVLGTLGIIVYGEMAGRVAAVAKQPVFGLMRERHGYALGLLSLVCALMVNAMTCTAEVGGIAVVLQLAGGPGYQLCVLAALTFLLIASWVLPFEGIERVFGLMGLFMTVFIAAAIAMRPDWSAVLRGFLPHAPPVESSTDYLLFAYYAVALLSAIMLPYEVYFYSSGGIEDGWKPSDLNVNRFVAVTGFTLGSVLCVAFILIGAQLLRPLHLEVQLPGTAVLPAAQQFGKWGVVFALTGMFFTFCGAAIETAFSGAYSVAQFFGWPWGKSHLPSTAARFTLAWMAMFVLAALIVLLGVDPIAVVEYSIVFSVVILPLTYLPTLVVARDEIYMKQHVNGRMANALGVFYLVLITLAAVAAIPLLLLTHGGKG